MELPFDLGFILIGTVCITLIWGIACASIGGILRFNLAEYVNDYTSDLDVAYLKQVTSGAVDLPKKLDDVDLGDWSTTLGVIAIIVGVGVIAYSAIGAVAGLLKHTTLIFVLIGTVLMCIMMQFALIWMIFDSNNSFHDNAKTDLVDRLHSDYKMGAGANSFSKAMSALMMAGECCGIRGWNDFNFNITYVKADKTAFFFKIPPVCCKSKAWQNADNEPDFFLTCGEQRELINQKGCYDVLFDEASDGTMGLYFWLLIAIMLWELVVIGVAVWVLFSHEEEIRAPTMPSPEEAIAEEEMKVFTPFSKLSSFPSSDINRIKSTEIW